MPWEPHGCAGSRFLSPLWPEALCKLSSRQPMRNSNNQCRPQHELRWSERPSCQTWSQRISLGVLRVVCSFHRSGLRGPFLGAVGTSSHKDPRVAAASSAGEGDPLTQRPGHGGWLSQHSLGPGSLTGGLLESDTGPCELSAEFIFRCPCFQHDGPSPALGFFPFRFYRGSFAELGSCCAWPLPREGCFSQVKPESRQHRCHTSVCPSVLCLVTTKIWSDRH